MQRRIHSTALVFVMLVPGLALAQQPDARAKAEAQKLYEDGAKDMEAEAYARACPKIEAAFKILPEHIRTGLTLADCWDKLSRPATALGVLESVAPLAKARGDKAKIAEIADLIANLNERVPKLTIRVPGDLATTPGLAITRNGMPLPAASWGTAVSLDPGEYEIEASAVDKPSWKKTVKLEARSAKTVDIDPGWTVPDSVVVPGPRLESPPPAPSAAPRIAGFVGIGLGAVGLGAWGLLGGLAISRNASADGHCGTDNLCNKVGFDNRSEAITLGHGATVGLIAGGVFAAVGVTLVLVSPRPKPAQRNASTETNVWVSPAGIGLRTTW